MCTRSSSSPAEMPLLMTAYVDSYNSYAASLADVDGRLADLSALENAIRSRMESAKQCFSGLEADRRLLQDSVEKELCLAREHQVEVREKLVELQHRWEQLAVYSAQRQSLVAEDEAAAVREAYWQELLRSQQHAIECVTQRHATPQMSSAADSSTMPRRHQTDNRLYTASSCRSRTPHPPLPLTPSPPQHRTTAALLPPTHSLSECWPEAVSATRNGHAAALAALLRRCYAAVQCTDAQGNTLLHLACLVEPPSMAVVRCLLSHGASLTAFNANGLTPFHVACLNLQDITHALKDAILAAGVSVDQRSQFGETAAHLLASHDAFLPSLEWLVDRHHANLACRAMVGGEMRTPLEVAEYYGGAQTACVRDLLCAITPHGEDCTGPPL
ncbi:hypothetical protein ABL78_2716 [Leptomonas seymouri]|uniref:Uncharacterized protein n=1 Tax=Leptomonas seymouri TaxID=5684 RepID=A0A0N1PCZ2_LEPSE|nr:hypothetical protein ABL78_2716 [Leptomonas seymouri]|eukprot:KPI88212.1 hypothetical protein ABL78_2716 [Leptomonas seymouri]